MSAAKPTPGLKGKATITTDVQLVAPPIPLDQSGNYIIRNIDTLHIQRAWLTVYNTSIEFDGELLERAAFLSKYAPIEYFPNDSSSTPGDTSGGEEME